MKDVEILQERDSDIYQVYLKGLREEHFDTVRDAANWVKNQPARKFYVSSKTLVNYIGMKMRGEEPNRMYSANYEKMEYLLEMYYRFISENPHIGLCREAICELLVDEPAPRFFLCTDSVQKAIYRERMRHLKKGVRNICGR